MKSKKQFVVRIEVNFLVVGVGMRSVIMEFISGFDESLEKLTCVKVKNVRDGVSNMTGQKLKEKSMKEKEKTSKNFVHPVIENMT